MRRIPCMIAASLLAAASAHAQIAWTVAPKVPLGCTVPITITNDTASEVLIGECTPWRVIDSNGAVVFDTNCNPFVPLPVPAGETLSFFWDQTDSVGQPLPAGSYTVFVDLQAGVGYPLELGGEATVAPLGALRVGTTRHVRLCSPQDAGLVHLLAAAFTSGAGIPLCATQLPLAPDALFFLSLDPAASFPSNGLGTLDAAGESSLPAFSVPLDPSLAGSDFRTAFAVLDPFAACPFVRASEALTLPILP